MVSILGGRNEGAAINIQSGLPPNWTIRKSKTHNKNYYYNQISKESSWEPPFGTDEGKLGGFLKELDNQPDQVRCNHFLVKHNGVRRPKSWKQDPITRSRDEAIQLLRGYEARILNGEISLSDLARTESDCSSHSQGGDLGFFGKGQMQPSFEKVAFGLQIGEISSIVESDSGMHLIERVE